MSYIVTQTEPIFDNRDAIVGSRTRPVAGLPAYETLGMAVYERNFQSYQAEAYGDIRFVVVDAQTGREVYTWTALPGEIDYTPSTIDPNDPFAD